MKRATLIGMFIAACAIGASSVASANMLATHAFDCKLAKNSSPWNSIAGDQYGAGAFTNGSGTTARGMCAVPFQDGFYNFQIGTSSSVTSCIMKSTSVYGSSAVYFPTSSGGGLWYFNIPLTAGTYATELECVMPNGSQIYYMGNY